MQRLSLLAGEPAERVYLHAEVAVLLKSRNSEVYSVLVQRFTANGEYAMARPCKTCFAGLKLFGVKEVRYTSPNGIILEKI